jgi:hypothetical protein
VIVKLDIDTAFIEYPLGHKLLYDKNGVYHKLVDQFFFEHDVVLAEIAPWWADSTKGLNEHSLDLFHGLRLIIGR